MNNYKEIEEVKKRIYNLCECRDEAFKKEIGEEYYTKTFTADFNIIDSYINDLEETIKKQSEYIKELEKEV
jgi:flagellar biosynthesis chaperone FliJ